MRVISEMTLSELAFVVCSALHRSKVTAVLTGGGAATFYAPEAYQSKDLDFVLDFRSSSRSSEALSELGFVQKYSIYEHPASPFTVEFPVGPLAIGEEVITKWNTYYQGDQLLNVISPTDSVRDRLAWLIFNNDFSGLRQAVAVAKSQEVDFDLVRQWCAAEGAVRQFDLFYAQF